MLNTDPTVIVFDLDDTLYKERDYVKSGTEAVLQLLLDTNILSQKTVHTFVADVDYSTGVIDRLCQHFNFDAKLKEALIWCYRLHEPQIKLEPETVTVLAWAKEFAAAIAIITDGRSVTQRLKLRALGLSHIKAFVSDEHLNGKPEPEMFLKVQEAWPNCRYAYIADNLDKDFLAPNKLGWITVGLLDDGRNIRRTNSNDSVKQHIDLQPMVWISDLRAIAKCLAEYY
jgi:putative hydrolase of the HAD superfamily